jgi:hypothetical protein
MIKTISIIAGAPAVHTHHVKCILLVINTRFIQMMVVLSGWLNGLLLLFDI